mgnify:CR=1 FL=1
MVYFRTLIFTWYHSARLEHPLLPTRAFEHRARRLLVEQQKTRNGQRYEKLNISNYASWSYKMHHYLLGHGYWSYVEGANDATPDSTHMDFPAWEQSASKVLYCFASSISDQRLSYIRDAKTPKEAWGNLKKIFAASITTMKRQL